MHVKTAKPPSLSLNRSDAMRDGKSHLRQIRLSSCLTLYASSLGAASVLVSFLVKTDVTTKPAHMPFIPAVFLAGSGGLAIMAATWPFASWLSKDASMSRSIFLWLGVGVGYGVLSPFIIGAVLPISAVFMDFALGMMDAKELILGVLSAFLRLPVYTFIHGAQALLTGLLAGSLFAIGAWIIDRLNASASPAIGKYGPWTAAIIFCSAVVLVSVFGPPDTLARLG